VPFIVDDDVLWFDVSVHNALPMQVHNGRQGFDKVKLGVFFFHSPDFPQQVEQFSSVAEFHDENQEVFSLERGFEFGDEGMVGANAEDGFLVVDYVGLVVTQNVLLVDDFHGHESSKGSDQKDFGKTSAADALDDLEVPQIVVHLDIGVFAAGNLQSDSSLMIRILAVFLFFF